MSIFDNKQELLNSLRIKENFLYSDFNNKYKIKSIKKKSGGERIIKPPITKLKTLQRKILDEIVSKKDLLPCVYGLSKEKGVRANALAHSRNWNKYVLCLDIENFFGNVHYHNVRQVYKELGFNEENANILTKCSTIDRNLPQGSPLSCHLSSLSLVNLDHEIMDYTSVRKMIYSRYIDDITISGREITQSDVTHIKSIIAKYRLTTNTKEQLFKPHEVKVITGVKLIENGVTITGPYEERLLSMSSLIDAFKNRTFIGKLGFFKYLNRKKHKIFVDSIRPRTDIL